MLPLQGGASLLALRAKCPVIPVYIDGGYKLFHKVTVRVGKPVEMDDLLAGRITRETTDELTARVESAFAKLSNGKSLPAPAKTQGNA